MDVPCVFWMVRPTMDFSSDALGKGLGLCQSHPVVVFMAKLAVAAVRQHWQVLWNITE